MSDSQIPGHFTVQCATCQHVQTMPISYRGLRAKCARCGTKFRAPQDPEAERIKAQRKEEALEVFNRGTDFDPSFFLFVILAVVAPVSLAIAWGLDNRSSKPWEAEIAVVFSFAFPLACLLWAIILPCCVIIYKLQTLIDLLRAQAPATDRSPGN